MTLYKKMTITRLIERYGLACAEENNGDYIWNISLGRADVKIKWNTQSSVWQLIDNGFIENLSQYLAVKLILDSQEKTAQLDTQVEIVEGVNQQIEHGTDWVGHGC